MPERIVLVRRSRTRPQARKVRRLEMNRAGVRAAIRQGRAWTALNTKRLPGLALSIVSLALLVFLFADPRFYVYDARVVGNRLIASQDIYESSGADMTSTFFLAPRTLQSKLLERFPGLAAVRVALGLPAQLTLHVIERPIRYAWEVGGQSYLADDRGIVLGVGAPPAEALRIQVTEGEPPAPGQALEATVLQTAADLSALLGGHSSFEYSPRHGISWRTPQGWPVHLGLGGDLPAKVAVMDTMIAQMTAQGVTPEFLDCTTPGRPYYR